ncbi:MAG: multiubiquitin domain-containing protein [Pseudobdellovibrio sp.]
MQEVEQKQKEKQIEITVNGRKKKFTGREISYAEVVALSLDGSPTDPNTVYTVTYRKGEDRKPTGSMVEGDVIKVKDGMVFNVTATTKS